MKKLFMLMLVSVLVLAACSNDDDAPDSLIGSTWKSSSTLYDADGNRILYAVTLSFTSSRGVNVLTERTYPELETKYEFDEVSATYSYIDRKKGDIELYINGLTYTGDVSDTSMTIEGDFDGVRKLTFTKQK